MRFVVDECTGPRVAAWLIEQGHEAISIFDDARGVTDDVVLDIANSGNYIQITNDKDFGEMIFREGRSHCGIIFLRLADERSAAKIEAIDRLIESYSDRLANAFVVVTERHVRFAE